MPSASSFAEVLSTSDPATGTELLLNLIAEASSGRDISSAVPSIIEVRSVRVAATCAQGTSARTQGTPALSEGSTGSSAWAGRVARLTPVCLTRERPCTSAPMQRRPCSAEPVRTL